MIKKILKWFGIVVVFFIAIGAILYMVYLRPVMKKMEHTEVINYNKNLTIVLGGGGNSGILVSDSLVVVIDSKMGDQAQEFHETVMKLAGNKPILIINTHIHNDHSEGNKYFKGQHILAGGNYTKDLWIKESGVETMPTDWLVGSQQIKLNNDTVTIFNIPRTTHTASDIVVYLHNEKMLFGGDVILNKQVPALLGNANPDAYVQAMNELPKQFDIQKVVPGHGPMGGTEIIINFQQYFTDMRTAADDASKESELVNKYNDWTQVPLVMSTGATISAMRKQKSNP
jgi:glyoxylase-like metal-dependent hydrolase (beta-lactamase superfamily II)